MGIILLLKLLIKVLPAFLLMAFTVVKKGHARQFLDEIELRADRFLDSFRKNDIRDILLQLHEFWKWFSYVFGAIAFIDLYFKSPSLLVLLAALALIDVSICWVLRHRESFKTIYLNSGTYLVILMPICCAIISPQSFKSFIFLHCDLKWLSWQLLNQYYLFYAAFCSFVILIVYVFIPYIIMWPIAYTVFLIMSALVFVLQRIISLGFKINDKVMYTLLAIFCFIERFINLH